VRRPLVVGLDADGTQSSKGPANAILDAMMRVHVLAL
jgi:hypothetical protein